MGKAQSLAGIADQLNPEGITLEEHRRLSAQAEDYRRDRGLPDEAPSATRRNRGHGPD